MRIASVRSIDLNLTIDSSELVMFNQGGRHTLDITHELPENIEDFDKVQISIQLDRDEQGRFNHVFGEAQKHRKQWDDINASDKKE